MSASIYTVNKGIGKPIEFKGLKAQYIWYLGGGVLGLLITFALLYLCGVHPFACLAFVLALGVGLFGSIYRLSHRYGAHGLLKKRARRALPRVLKANSRQLFIR